MSFNFPKVGFSIVENFGNQTFQNTPIYHNYSNISSYHLLNNLPIAFLITSCITVIDSAACQLLHLLSFDPDASIVRLKSIV